MASRKYWPTLVKILRTVCVYIARYTPQLEVFLQQEFGSAAVTALHNVNTACMAFTSLVEQTEAP